MHILCPHCRNPIELVRITPEEILCSSCGSTFRLEAEAEVTRTWAGGEGQGSLGRFELLETVGSGAFGTVYKARDSLLDRAVAVKVPRAGNVGGTEDRARFLREARSTAQLRHPAIVPVHEVGEEQGVPFIVSDFVAGVNLSEWLTSRKLTYREAAVLTAEVADALHYAHGLGVVHRDIKPSNVMLDGEGRPHVMDFGLAKRDAGEITMTLEGQVLGTPAYMSPEQARGEGHTVDGRSDVYSLGVILYLLLTGELPFRGATRMLLHQVLHDDPKPPRKLNDRIPRDLETITLKALAKEPGRRYSTARDLADDLRRWLGGQPIRARPIGRTERLWRWSRRNPALAASLFIGFHLLLIVALLSFGIAVLQSKSAQRSRAAQLQLEFVNEQYREQRERADLQRIQAELDRTNAFLDRGLALVVDQDGRQGEGLLWMARSLRLAPDRPESDGLRDAARSNLAYWGSRIKPQASLILKQGFEVWNISYGPGNRQLLAWKREENAALGRTDDDSARELKNSSELIVAGFSPDGLKLVTGHGDNIARLWNVETGRPIGGPLEHEKPEDKAKGDFIIAVAFSPDSRRVATSSRNGSIRLWDAETGRPIGPDLGGFRSQGTIVRVAVGTLTFTGDGRWLVARSQGFTNDFSRLIDVAKTAPAAGPYRQLDGSKSLTPSPDGSRFATAIWDEGRIFQAIEAEQKARDLKQAEPPDKTAGNFADWLANWQKARQDAATEPRDNTAQLWDAATGKPIGSPLTHQRYVHLIVFSPDNRRFVTVGGSTVRLSDAATGAAVGESFDAPAAVSAVAFRPDGRIVAIGCVDKTVALLDASTGRALRSPWRSLAGTTFLAFSPDGARLVTGTNAELRMYEPRTGKPIGLAMRPPSGAAQVRFSPDGLQLLARSYPVYDSHLWSLDPPVSGSPERVEAWAEDLVGGTLDTDAGIVRPFDDAARRRAKDRLDRLTGAQ